MVQFVRQGLVTYYYGEQKEIKVIFEALTVFIEGAVFSTKYKNGWDGNARFYNKAAGCFWYGLIERVLDALSKRRIEYVVEGYEDLPTEWIQFSDKFLSKERTYQRNAIQAWFERGYGTIMIPTRGGKTFVASEIIRLLNEREKRQLRTLFLVDNVDLFNQAINDISLITGIKAEDIGKIRGTDFQPKSVNIGMIQTIQSALKGKVTKKSYTKQDVIEATQRKHKMKIFLKELEFIIIDEVQEYGSSKPRLEALRQMTSLSHILSISATPYRYKNLIHQLNVDGFSGGVVYEIHEKELVKNEVLAESRILLLLFEHFVKKYQQASTYQDVVEKLVISNASRNGVILGMLALCDSLGLKTLAMFNSVKHGKIISSLSGYSFLSGEDDENTRDKMKKHFLSESGGVLLVSDIWKKGITLPSVEILFNVDGGKEASLVIQRRGRVLGTTDSKKKALTIDFIDLNAPYLGDHSLSRINAYETKIDSSLIDVIDTRKSAFISDLEEYLINWFELNIQNG